jgi:hypothetical protein
VFLVPTFGSESEGQILLAGAFGFSLKAFTKLFSRKPSFLPPNMQAKNEKSDSYY